MTSVALRNPVAVSCFSGERNTTEATSDGLEEPVGELADEPDREELAEVGARESPADPFERARPGVHRAVRLSEPAAGLAVRPRRPATSKNRVQSWSSAWPLPRMKLSTMSCAASSENCTGGDFMK